MPPRQVLVALAALLVVAGAVVYAVSSREAESPEALVKKQIERAARAAEKRDLAEVMDVVSARYPDRDEAKRFLFMQLRGEGWKKVGILGVDVHLEPSGDRAKAAFEAVLAKGESKDGSWRDLAPSDATVYHFELVFEREDEWRVTRGTYARASLRGGP